MSGKGLVAPTPFGGPGMFNPTPMANQGQPGLQQTPAGQVDARFGGMQPPAGASFAERFGGMQPPTQPTPNQYVAQNFPQQQPVPMPQPRPQMAQPVPMPQPRPAQAQPDTNFFMRNALMMQDPATGGYIDPTGASRAQSSGGDLIQKMMGLLHNKANNA